MGGGGIRFKGPGLPKLSLDKRGGIRFKGPCPPPNHFGWGGYPVERPGAAPKLTPDRGGAVSGLGWGSFKIDFGGGGGGIRFKGPGRPETEFG